MLDKIAEINPDAVLLSGFDSEIIGIANLSNRQVIVTNPITNDVVLEYEIDYDDSDMNYLVDNEDDMTIDGLWGRTEFQNLIVYDANKIIEKLSDDMGEDEAWEYYYFNIEGAYFGPTSPIFKKINELI